MYPPTQSQPVQRALNTEAGAYHSTVAGIGPSAQPMFGTDGVQPDGFFDDILGVVKTVAPVAGPILGALGI